MKDVDLYDGARDAARREYASVPTQRRRGTTRQQGDGDRREGVHEAVRCLDEAWGSTKISSDFQWGFRPTENPWEGKRVFPWALGMFADSGDVLERIKATADELGPYQQARHVEHLLEQIAGRMARPWSAKGKRTDSGQDIADMLGGALLEGYGPNPVPDFLAAMQACGIVPLGVKVGAGNVLHQFHVAGDPHPVRNGWAILHRCPGAGSFGSWRTGEVHRWHSRPDQLESAGAQFEEDYRRASREKYRSRAAA